jgi:molybdenum cofactor synthesis domain-containing protein
MDGYAVRADDVPGPKTVLRVTGTVHAGAVFDGSVGAGEAVRIMTGAPMPAGADAVVMVERTEPVDGGTRVEIEGAVRPGENVRRAGDDVQPGDTVLAAGSVLGPAALGVLANLGIAEVVAHPRPRVGILSTGDELVEGPVALRPGQIRDSNRPALLAAAAASGFETVDLGLVPDDEHAIEEALRRGVASCDAVLSSGGVSMGDVDLVKVVLDRIGDMRWMQISIRPAKPLAFGVVGDTPVFGLPGNPVSSLVSYELFARPGLRKRAGFTDLDRPRVRAVAAEALPRRPDGKIHFVRVRCDLTADGRYQAASAGGQGSHQLTALAHANALGVLPDGPGVEAGADLEVILLDAS